MVIRRESGTGFGTGAGRGDMILLDVRGGGQFHVNYCQWGTVVAYQAADGTPTTAANAAQVVVNGRFRPQAAANLRPRSSSAGVRT